MHKCNKTDLDLFYKQEHRALQKIVNWAFDKALCFDDLSNIYLGGRETADSYQNIYVGV